MHQQPPHTPLCLAASAAKAGHVSGPSALIVYSLMLAPTLAEPASATPSVTGAIEVDDNQTAPCAAYLTDTDILDLTAYAASLRGHRDAA